jgi:hypothetical protein
MMRNPVYASLIGKSPCWFFARGTDDGERLLRPSASKISGTALLRTVARFDVGYQPLTIPGHVTIYRYRPAPIRAFSDCRIGIYRQLMFGPSHALHRLITRQWSYQSASAGLSGEKRSPRE